MSADFGRRGSTGVYTDTIKPKSAEQAMLLQLDQVVSQITTMTAELNTLVTALKTAATIGDVNAAATAFTTLVNNLATIKLVP